MPQSSVKNWLFGLNCPDCGGAISDKDIFCRHCGVNLDKPIAQDAETSMGSFEDVPIKSQPSAMAQDSAWDRMFGLKCPDCGGAISDKDIFCRHCGVNLGKPSAQDAETGVHGARIERDAAAQTPPAGNSKPDRSEEFSPPPTQPQFQEVSQSQEVQKQPQSPLIEALSADAIAGAGAGPAAPVAQAVETSVDSPEEFSVKDQPGAGARGRMNLTTCPNCKIQVWPRSDGTCPSCQAVITQQEEGSISRPVEPIRKSAADTHPEQERAPMIGTKTTTMVNAGGGVPRGPAPAEPGGEASLPQGLAQDRLVGLKCPGCGSVVSDKDIFCPHCGVNLGKPVAQEAEVGVPGAQIEPEAAQIPPAGDSQPDREAQFGPLPAQPQSQEASQLWEVQAQPRDPLLEALSVAAVAGAGLAAPGAQAAGTSAGGSEVIPVKCPNCGMPTSEKDLFCPYCGVKLDKPVTQDAETGGPGAQIEPVAEAQTTPAGDSQPDREAQFGPPPAQPESREVSYFQETQKQPQSLLQEVQKPPQEPPQKVQKKPQNPLIEALSAGAFAGAGAGLAAHLFAGGKLTFPIWIAAYVLVIANVKNKLVATIVFVATASLVSVIYGSLAPSQ